MRKRARAALIQPYLKGESANSKHLVFLRNSVTANENGKGSHLSCREETQRPNLRLPNAYRLELA